MITVVSQCIGAGNYEQAKYYTKKLMKLTYILCFIMTSITLLLLPIVLHLYHLSNYTELLVIKLVIYHGFCVMTIWSFAWALPYTLRAAGDVKFTMTVAIISMWIFRVGLGIVLGIYVGLGVLGVWIAMTIDWLVRGICFAYRYFQGKWTQQQV